MGLAQALSTLWDSRRQLPVSGAARAGILPWIRLRLWDSRGHPAHAAHTTRQNDLKFLKRSRRRQFNSFGKPQVYARVLPLVGCQCIYFHHGAMTAGEIAALFQ